MHHELLPLAYHVLVENLALPFGNFGIEDLHLILLGTLFEVYFGRAAEGLRLSVEGFRQLGRSKTTRSGKSLFRSVIIKL